MMIAADAAKALGMSIGKFLARLHKGMSVDDIATVPTNTRKPVTYNGVLTSLQSVCDEAGIPYQRIFARINVQGLTLEEAIRRG